ncbi:heme NO-binding domain-containing protein [Alteromonas lipolytica]|uniref:2,4-dihydroxyhept-2-ene-1,7-dioic acid aldolase n=1 Tax=Alteromonas lipolytica TaxID=1856405 RepID=A0A1E8FBC6_9ALTE|nr:heme NO-binding domain-containing protein [Alteromonas lipolytica]OFI33221.1 2,4-dihydroxyhept-2-ene-1,7-dioic acid aldolase [Alteromonas lipolytica]GGF61526.1 guanylate cyclase [Alteromonas lipolytica]
MLGVVFTSLVEMLEEHVSPEFADEVLEEANLENDGAFTAVGYYPFSELEKIMVVLINKTGRSANELLYDYGKYLFSVLSGGHAEMMINRQSVLEILDCLDDDIHVQVRKLYPDADLPSFKVLARTDNSISLEYYSVHDLYALAEGLIDGAAGYFSEQVEHQVTPLSSPHTYKIDVKLIES